MKADLHLHTKFSSKNGDSIRWIGLYEVLKKLCFHKIKMISFTDHNYFDAEQYLEARKLCDTVCMSIFPGVEMNVVKKNGVVAHMLILFRENLDENKLYEIEDITRKVLKSGVSINKINDFYNGFDTIRIIHIGKSDHFEWTDLEGLNYDAFEITNRNNDNYLRVLKAGYKSSVVSFSDTHNWDDYPQHNKTLKTIFKNIKDNTFDSLKEILKTNQDFTMTLDEEMGERK